MKTEKIVLIVITVTLIIAAVQAVQFVNLKNTVENNEFVSMGTASSIVTVGGGSNRATIDISADILDIPDQVGGCF